MKRRGFLLMEGLLALALSACLAAAVFPGAAYLAGAAAHTEERLRADEESLTAVLYIADGIRWSLARTDPADGGRTGNRYTFSARERKRGRIYFCRGGRPVAADLVQWPLSADYRRQRVFRDGGRRQRAVFYRISRRARRGGFPARHAGKRRFTGDTDGCAASFRLFSLGRTVPVTRAGLERRS